MMPTAKCAILLVLVGSALARPDGTGGHHQHGHHAEHVAADPAPAPSSGYAEPAAAYSAPASAYGAPDAGYSAPEAGYGAPEAAYAAPSASGYGPPAYGSYEQTAPEGLGPLPGIDLTTLLIPILIIAGLALLFPSTTTVDVNRRKRSAEDEEPTIMERMVDIMESVTTSEGCMERIACEVGGMADQAGMDKTMSRLAESFVSKKAQKLMKKFNGSQDCRKIKCGMF